MQLNWKEVNVTKPHQLTSFGFLGGSIGLLRSLMSAMSDKLAHRDGARPEYVTSDESNLTNMLRNIHPIKMG